MEGASGGSNRLTEIAVWAAGLRVDEIPSTAVERARLQLAATLAAARAGAGTGAARRLRAATGQWAAKGPCAVVGEPFGLEPAAAAYLNAAASIAHDWDDYLYMGHTGHSAVWASRAVAQAAGAPDESALVAQVAANEVAGRLGAALFLGPHNGQLWSSIHCAGAAVAAGKLMGLDPERLGHALATALYQPPYALWPGFMGPDTKLLTAAEPCAQGVRAALLAAAGFKGPLDVIDDRRGLLTHFSFAPRPSMLGALGSVWLTETLAYKPHPGCAYLQAAVDLLLGLQREHGFSAAEVVDIDAQGGLFTTGMERLSAGGEVTPVRITFSVALSAAAVLDAGRLTHRELDEERVAERRQRLRDLAGRVRVRHDWNLTLATVEGVARALPASELARDVPLSRWPAVRRRMRELHMDELGLGAAELRELLARPQVRRAIAAGALRLAGSRDSGAPGPRGLAALDTARLRLTFPMRVRIRLRSGRTLEAEGDAPGGGGAPLPEQRQVVAAKWEAVGGRPEELADLLGRRSVPA